MNHKNSKMLKKEDYTRDLKHVSKINLGNEKDDKYGMKATIGKRKCVTY